MGTVFITQDYILRNRAGSSSEYVVSHTGIISDKLGNDYILITNFDALIIIYS